MTPEQYFSRRDLINRWKISLRSLDRLRFSGLLPWFDLSGGRGARPIVRFRLVDVEQFENAMSVRGGK